MIKALFYKEWIKTRKIVIFLLLAIIAVSTYMIIDNLRVFKLVGLVHIWDVIVNKNSFIFKLLNFIPVSVGVILALSQFFIEYSHRRIKLSLHLPLKESKLITILISYGLVILVSLYAVQLLILGIFMHLHFAHEIVLHYFYTITPWYLAGFCAYALVSYVCLEPIAVRKFILSLFSLAYMYLFFLEGTPGAYSNFLCFLTLYSFIPYTFIYVSAWRLKFGTE